MIDDIASLESALGDQKLVRHNKDLARELAKVGEQLLKDDGQTVYKEGDQFVGVFFILVGKVRLTQGGNILQDLAEDEEFGIRPLISKDTRYKVTATAITETLLLRVNRPAFEQLAETYPELWKNLVRTQHERLDRQNQLFLPQNSPMIMFIGSSSEGLGCARNLRDCFTSQAHIKVSVWDEVFENMYYPLETLTKELDTWDFAAFVWTPDDMTDSRAVNSPSPRDNVVLEVGLSIGRLGRDRTFVLVPDVTSESQLKIPSDLRQIALMSYDVCNMSKAGDRILKEIDRLKPRIRMRYQVTRN
jgi:CRP/FNR family cyclic AMP-dependent transcriptional regulator